MTGFTRRDTLKFGAGALAGTTLLGYRPAFGEVMAADVPAPKFQIENGAELRVLRPSKFVQGDETAVPREHQEVHRADRRPGHGRPARAGRTCGPRRRRAAAIGSGPDIVFAWSDDPHKFEDTVRRPDRPRRPISARSMAAGGRSSRSTARARRPANGSPCRSAAPATASSIASPGSTRPATRRSRRDLDGFLDHGHRSSRPTATRSASRSATRTATPTPGATG